MLLFFLLGFVPLIGWAISIFGNAIVTVIFTVFLLWILVMKGTNAL